MSQPFVKTPVFAEYKEMIAVLNSNRLIRPDNFDPDRMVPERSGIDYGKFNYASGRLPVVLSGLPTQDLQQPAQELFEALHYNIMAYWAYRSEEWNTPTWRIVTPAGETLVLTNDQMIFAIRSIRFAAFLGGVLENDLGGILSSLLGGEEFIQVLPKLRINQPGPDGFFLAGGRRLGLPQEAFSVEAKAGASALQQNVVEGIERTLKTGGYSQPYTQQHYKDRMRVVCEQEYRRHLPNDFATLLFGFTFSMQTNVKPKLHSRTGTFFNRAIILNAFGQPLYQETFR